MEVISADVLTPSSSVGDAGLVIDADNSDDACSFPEAASLVKRVVDSSAVVMSSPEGVGKVVLWLGMFSVTNVMPASRDVAAVGIKSCSVVVSSSLTVSVIDSAVV